MRKSHYNFRWGRAGHPDTANVSLEATSDASARRVADKIARDLGVTNTPRSMFKDGEFVEVLEKGVSHF